MLTISSHKGNANPNLRFHLTTVRKRNPSPLLVGMQASATTLEKNWSLLKNLNTDLPYDPEIPFLGIYPK
jgi:hypothetical protein